MQTNLLVKHVSTITRLVIFCRGKKEILMKVYFDDVDDDEKKSNKEEGRVEGESEYQRQKKVFAPRSGTEPLSR